MASRSLGTLTLDLIARIGGYEQGLDKAEREAKKRAAAIEKAFDNAFKATTAGLAVLAAAGVTALSKINAQAETIASFQDLADKIGDSAEQVATLQKAAALSGTQLDTVASASVKLTASLAQTGDEGNAVALALKNIGLGFDEFKRLTPVEQLDAVAKALAGFADGAGKTATAVALFGKSGAELIPFLNDLAKEGERQVSLTAEQIAAADDYTKTTKRLRAEFEAFTQQQTSQYIPVLSQVQNVLADVAKNSDVVATATWLVEKAVNAAITVFQTLIIVGSDVAFVFKMTGQEIGGMAAQLAALARLDIKGFHAISDAMKEDAALARKTLDDFQARVMRIGQTTPLDDEQRKLLSRLNYRPPRPTLTVPPPRTGARAGAGVDTARQALDAQLKQIERLLSGERDLLAERNKFLDLYNNQGLLSIEDYYSRQANILDEATRRQADAYAAQIRLLQDYIVRAAPKDRASAQEKLNDLLEKQARLQRDAGLAALEAGIKQTQAQEQYQNTIRETNARLLELQGEVGKAAAIRFDAQNEGLLKLFGAEGNREMLEKVNRIRELTVAQADLNKLSGDYSLIQSQLQIAEDRIALAQKLGTQGEIDGLVKLGEARQASYEQLRQIAEQYERIARASGDAQMILKADQLKLALAQLGAELDPLANKIDTTIGDAAGAFFEDIFSGTKSAKAAIKDFGDTVYREFSSLIAKQLGRDLMQSLFGGSGDGGFGNWFSGLLGGKSSGGGFGGWFGDLLGGIFGGGRANGGPVQPNSLYRVNERGPELFEAANGEQYLMTGTSGGRVQPHPGTRANNLTVYVQAAPNMSRDTALQQGAQIGAGIQRALARNA